MPVLFQDSSERKLPARGYAAERAISELDPANTYVLRCMACEMVFTPAAMIPDMRQLVQDVLGGGARRFNYAPANRLLIVVNMQYYEL